MASEYVGELKKWIAQITTEAGRQNFVGLTRVVDLVSKNFGVQPSEVAIFALATDERFLRFVVPEALKSMGLIPLSSANSLAARTAREKRPEVINHFAFVPHASVFEAVPIGDQRGEPIQKIMSVPIVLDKKLVGVMQVSRKGKTGAEAGPDFTPTQLRELKAMADTVAVCVPLVERN